MRGGVTKITREEWTMAKGGRLDNYGAKKDLVRRVLPHVLRQIHPRHTWTTRMIHAALTPLIDAPTEQLSRTISAVAKDHPNAVYGPRLTSNWRKGGKPFYPWLWVGTEIKGEDNE